jgi:hypothetical protein
MSLLSAGSISLDSTFNAFWFGSGSVLPMSIRNPDSGEPNQCGSVTVCFYKIDKSELCYKRRAEM